MRRALDWWLQVLELDLSEKRSWKQPLLKPGHLFCDARGDPAHLGAVLWLDGVWWWTHRPVSLEELGFFARRRDNQIMGLELLSISLGMCSFADIVRGRQLVIHSDNTGSEVCMLFGLLRAFVA